MTVKELIEQLQTLDQDKQIKFASNEGYESEYYARNDIIINDYKKTIKHIYKTNGEYSHEYSDITNCTGDSDFYILGAYDFMKS